MNKLRKLFSLLCALMALSASAQCRYCLSYEDFMEGRWLSLDSVDVNTRSAQSKFWWGGNDYTLKGADKSIDKILKKEAFAVLADHRLFVNCHKLKIDGAKFGNGYVQAMMLGKKGLVFANRKTGSAQSDEVFAAGFFFGAAGAAIAASNQLKNQVCYLITKGTDGKKDFDIKALDDKMVSNFLLKYPDLLDDYYFETNPSKRMEAAHIMPLLKKAGLFTKTNQVFNETTEETN